MPTDHESLREGLLSRLPKPENLSSYRTEVASTLDRTQRAFRREKRFVVALWIFSVCLSTVFLTMGAYRFNTLAGIWSTILAGFVLIYPSAELLKHFINRSRVELLKEVKQLQLEVLEVHALLGTRERQ